MQDHYLSVPPSLTHGAGCDTTDSNDILIDRLDGPALLQVRPISVHMVYN